MTKTALQKALKKYNLKLDEYATYDRYGLMVVRLAVIGPGSRVLLTVEYKDASDEQWARENLLKLVHLHASTGRFSTL